MHFRESRRLRSGWQPNRADAVPGLVRPPFGDPTGPLVTDISLVSAFIGGARTGYSPRFHIEESTLMLSRFTAVSVRLETQCLLMRTDVRSRAAEQIAVQNQLNLALSNPPLATVVSLQVLALPSASWDLWCVESIDAQKALEEAVVNGPAGGGART